MHQLKYIVYKEDEYYLAQCLNVDVSSFDETIDGALANLKEAVELYLEGDKERQNYHAIEETMIGDMIVNG